jgi:chorismate dehydratase
VQPLRVACVEYFNTKPLIEGLDIDTSVRLSLAVPAKLIDSLARPIDDPLAADIALLPTIDYPSLQGLRVIPSAGIGCDGPTLTVRLFARVPIEHVDRVVCDVESHTSVALAKILFAKLWNTSPTFVPGNDARGGASEARLLIGDKVICEPPAGMPHQVDLGDAWKQLTGLPFVFAIWTARPGVELGDLPATLEAAKKLGLSRASELVTRYAVPRGWPADVALAYVTRYLNYDIGPRQLEAIRRFHTYANELGVLTHQIQPLRLAQGSRDATAALVFAP